MTEKQELSKKREPYWDNVKAILILLVVVAHFMSYTPNTVSGAIYQGIYFFHMPLFIFVSGIFFKPIKIKERAFGLLIIGICYNCILIFIDNIFLKYEQEIFLVRATKIPWFVFCIAICTVITYFIKDCNPVLILVVSIIMGCFACYDHTLMSYVTLSKAIGWFPYFYLGHLFSEKNLINRKMAQQRRNVILICGGLLITYVMTIICTRKMDYSIFSFSFLFGCQQAFVTNEYKWLIVKMGYYVGVCVISCSILVLIPHRKIPLLTYMGERTMQIYFWHIPVRSLVSITGVQQEICKDAGGLMLWTFISILVAVILSVDVFKFPTHFILRGVNNVNGREKL